MATARSCSTSGVERPIDSSSVTSASLAFASRPLMASTFRVQPDSDRGCMAVEIFGACKRNGRRAEGAKLVRTQLEDRGALDEIEHRQPRREPRRARRRQYVVRAADIIADDFRRVAADEDRTGIADFRHEGFGV